MNPASRTQKSSKSNGIEDEIAQINDVNLVLLWDPRARSLARLLAVCASPAASRFRSFVSQSCVACWELACSLARGPPWRERERERERSEREFVGFVCSFLFQRIVLLCFCLPSLTSYYCISHVCCCHCCCAEVSNEVPPGGGGGCSIPVFFSRSSLCSSAAASVLEAAAAAIKLVEFSSLVLTWRGEEENYESDHQRRLVVV